MKSNGSLLPWVTQSFVTKTPTSEVHCALRKVSAIVRHASENRSVSSCVKAIRYQESITHPLDSQCAILVNPLDDRVTSRRATVVPKTIDT